MAGLRDGDHPAPCRQAGRSQSGGEAVGVSSRYALAVDNEPMTTIAWNKSHVYWLAFAGFALMALRAVQVAVENWRRSYSVLEKPEAFME